MLYPEQLLILLLLSLVEVTLAPMAPVWSCGAPGPDGCSSWTVSFVCASSLGKFSKDLKRQKHIILLYGINDEVKTSAHPDELVGETGLKKTFLSASNTVSASVKTL